MKLRHMFAPFGADGFYLLTHAGTAVSVAEGEAMESRNSPDVDVIKSAERIVYQEKWRICGERAAAQLATTSSVRRGQVSDCNTFQTAVWALVCGAALRSAVPMIDPKISAQQHFSGRGRDCHDAN
jgi:hypothetical protein